MAVEDGKMNEMTQEMLIELVQSRIATFEKMMNELPEKKYHLVELREEAGFTARMAVKKPHEGKRGIFIICAGGGFLFKSYNEALPVAEYFYEKGINVAILDYHTNPNAFGEEVYETIRMAGEDGMMAVRHLRMNAESYGIDPDHIAIGGFSAGGMLSGYVATQYDAGNPDSDNPILRVSCRPDATLLMYGAFSFTNTVSPSVGRMSDAEIARANKVDNCRNIHVGCPPMFVFQTHEDDPRIALNFCYELAVHGVPYEIHTFENGSHGGGLYNGENETPNVAHTAMWAELAASWLKSKGFFGN